MQFNDSTYLTSVHNAVSRNNILMSKNWTQTNTHTHTHTHHMYVHSLCLQLDTRTLLFTWLSSLQPSEPGRPCLLKNLCGTGAQCQPTNVVKALKELQALTAIILRPACVQLVAWHNGITLVFGRRTFLVLRSTCS